MVAHCLVVNVKLGNQLRILIDRKPELFPIKTPKYILFSGNNFTLTYCIKLSNFENSVSVYLNSSELGINQLNVGTLVAIFHFAETEVKVPNSTV